MPSLRQKLRRALQSRSALRETNRCLLRIAEALDRLAAKHGAPIVDLTPADTPLADRWEAFDPIKEADYALLEEIEARFTADTGRGPTETELLGQFDEIRRREGEIEELAAR